MKSQSFRILATGLLVLSSTSALAQVPTTVDPGRLLDRLSGGSSRPTPTHAPIVVKEGKETKAAKGDTTKVFTLKTVVVEGSSVYGAKGPQAAYAQYVGKEVSFADLQTIAEAMTAAYRNDGYILSRVVLSPQKIGGGEVHFQALEGYVDQVELQGEIRGDKELINSYASKIKADRPLNSKTLERYLLLMDDLPGVTARGVLKASPTQKGASTLIVQLSDKEFEGSVQLDNRGNKFIGPYQIQAVGAVNSLFGMYDRNTVRLLTTPDMEELRYGDFNNEMQLGTEGTRLNTRVAFAATHPKSTLEPLDLEGRSVAIEVSLLHPLMRSREQNLFLRGGFLAQDSHNESADTELFDDQVRHADVGFDFDTIDNWSGINKVSGTVTQGLDVFGASSEGTGRSRNPGEQSFTKFGATVTRIQDITNTVALFGSVTGQYSCEPLLSSEQFSIGGEGFGRAYDGGEIAGDDGVAAILELRYRGVPEDQSIVTSYEPYIFYDGGAVWLKDPAVGENDRSSLTSTGIGSRVNFADNYSGYVEVSLPLTRDVASEGDRDARLFFNLSKRF